MDDTSSLASRDLAAPSGQGALPLISQLRSRLESILLVIDSPASVEELARVLDAEVTVVSDTLRALEYELSERGSGIDPVSYTHLTLPTIYSV